MPFQGFSYVWNRKESRFKMYIFPIFEIGDLRSCLKSRIETDVHVNYDDTELENKGKYLVQ